MTVVPRISVLIPTFNRCSLLARTLPTILSQDLASDQFEVIVIVDGSSDQTLQVLQRLERPTLRIIVQGNLGQACAYNAGLAQARGEYVLFLDDDIICKPSLLSAHLEAHQSDRNLVVSGPVLLSAESPENVATDWLRYAEEQYEKPCAELLVRQWPADTKVDANTSVRRSRLLEAGGFSSDLPARFDLELGLRLHRLGCRFALCRAAAAWQIYSKRPSELFNDAQTYGRYEIVLAQRYPELRSAITAATLNKGSFWKRLIKSLAIDLAAASQNALWLTKVLDRFRRFEFLRRFNLKLFRSTLAAQTLRSSRMASGSKSSWHSGYQLTAPVLLYHHVGPRRHGSFTTLTVSPMRFERHLRYLAEAGFTGITTSQWIAWCLNGEPLPDKPILLTFDDGYKDLATFAFPALIALGWGATAFVVTSQIGGTNLWDQENGSAAHVLMDAQDISYWAARGIEFGSHSHTHPDLKTLQNTAQVEEEIVSSKRILESIVQREILTFAYPYGAADQRVRQWVASTYTSAHSTEIGLNSLGSDRTMMRRSMVMPGDTRIDLLMRAQFGWNPLEGVRIRAARLRGRV